MKKLPHFNALACIACVFASFIVGCAQTKNVPGTVTRGKTRLTVITPNLVRIETSNNGKFIDEPSLFAVDRAARFKDYRTVDKNEIDTGPMRVTLDGDNVRAKIRKGDEWIDWTPGSKQEQNLGGTIRTLDGVSEPVDLKEGILSRDGWFAIDDSKTPLLTDDWVKARPNDAGRDIYLFGYGDDYRAALKSLTTIGGPVPMPRKYMLGTWYSRYWNYTSDDFKQIVKEYEEHDFPLDVMVMDMDWHITQVEGAKRAHAGLVWTGYTWDKKLIPDPKALLKWFHEQGLHVTLNDHPADGVQPHEEMYAAFMQDMDAPITDPPTTLPFDAGDKKYLDAFWKHTHQTRLDEGADFWWLDWQQYPNTRSIPELTNLAWLNWYYYKHTTSNDTRGASFSRWAGFGDHRHPIHFSGDAATNWATLAFEVPFTSTAGNVGCFFWSHDIGGHMGGRNEESYTRWCQFGAMTAALRSHSTRDATMDRRPWAYPKWAEDSMRKSFHLRSELFPYIYSAVAQSASQSVPLNRPMYFDWSKEEKAYQNPQQFMLGNDLLVAPIASPGAGPNRVSKQIVWFPPGAQWFNVFTGERYEGGGNEQLVAADIDEFPLYARAGTPIAMQPYTARMGTAELGTLRVRVYPTRDAETHSSVLYEDDGETPAYAQGKFGTTNLSARRRHTTTRVTIGKAQGTYRSQSPQRDIIVELPCTSKATEARANGKSAEVDYDEATKTNRVRVNGAPINRETVVSITCDVADQAAIRTAARERRLSGSGDNAEARLAIGGIALLETYRNPTMQGPPELRFVAPANVSRAQVSVRDETGETVVSPRELKLTNGFAIVPAADNLPLSDKHRSLVVSFEQDGAKQEILRVLPYDQRVLKRETNVAKDAVVTASSVENSYSASGAIDGAAGGYPADRKQEWASDNEKAGAWLELKWHEPVTVDTILLFDRPNTSDQILGGTIEFDDGSKLEVGEVKNDGSEPFMLRFPAKTIRTLKLTITKPSAGTHSSGISEIAVFRVAEPAK